MEAGDPGRKFIFAAGLDVVQGEVPDLDIGNPGAVYGHKFPAAAGVVFVAVEIRVHRMGVVHHGIGPFCHNADLVVDIFAVKTHHAEFKRAV